MGSNRGGKHLGASAIGSVSRREALSFDAIWPLAISGIMSYPHAMPWRRTWPDSHHDFVLETGGRAVGRIYQHPDNSRWQWFGWTEGGRTGVCDTRAEAVAALEALARESSRTPR